LAFGSLHTQYDVYGLVAVVACGILFGMARWRTGSLWLCVLLHGFMNLIATVEIMFFT
jgi:membrane protease YdiL (CAAX protease family)